MPPKKRPPAPNSNSALTSFGFTAKKTKIEELGSENLGLALATGSQAPTSSTDAVTVATTTSHHDVAGPGALTHDDVEEELDEDEEPVETGSGSGTAMMELEHHRLPKNWGLSQWRSWKERNPWLCASECGLGCAACQAAKTLLLHDKKTGMHISDAWVNGTVSSPLQKQLRKKIYLHRDSLAHKRAVEIADLKQKDVLPNKVEEMSSAFIDVTSSSFRAAYTVAKERLPYSKMTPIMKLNELNGAKVGPAHRSDHSCAAIVEHVADEMKKRLVSHVLALDSRISITLDESTVHGRSYMIIYMRCDVTGNGDVENDFLDIVELEKGDAASIYNALKDSLQKVGIEAEFLKRNFISIATDGAAVLTGRHTGLIQKLQQDFPKLQGVHCLAHRLELAVTDSLKVVSGCNHFEIFISKLHSLYHQSTKNAKELEKAAVELNMQILKIGKVFTIRWVASSFRTVKAVVKDFPVLANHFRMASEDDSRTGVERTKYGGLLKHLISTGFLLDLAVMKDVLRELQGLSLRLQRRDTSLVDASRYVHQTIEVLSEYKIHAGITSGQFKGVVLRETQPKINKPQFYQSILDNLRKRLPDSELIAMLKPLDQHFWPSERSDVVLFGEREVGRFAKLLGESSTEAIEEFRDWKLQGSQGKILNKLIVACHTVLPTSAECERGFSACNDTDDKTRNRLRAPSLAALLFIDLNGPPIEKFNPVPFVLSWLKKGHRTSASWIPGPRPQPAESRAVWSVLSP
ncbi:E3 SUMO-protein ligase KIAA1586-like [Platichthys flesus]|uniref:E3 SUMO-protein ligase KIAA1586-like n=1 Tax=Platichthys flesus TaxID=8260 RepID=UPI002DBB3E10|nr:E3 SUMO-protein ligase KIAA1586-like [Platichthys flesus]